MRKVVLIPDSFKGTMSSSEICSIMAAVAGHGGKAYRYPLTLRIV